MWILVQVWTGLKCITLYVELAHVLHPLNTKLLLLFLLNGCPTALLRDTPARSSRFQVHGNSPAIASTRKVAEQRLIKMAFSCGLFIIIIIINSDQIFLYNGFIQKCINIILK